MEHRNHELKVERIKAHLFVPNSLNNSSIPSVQSELHYTDPSTNISISTSFGPKNDKIPFPMQQNKGDVGSIRTNLTNYSNNTIMYASMDPTFYTDKTMSNLKPMSKTDEPSQSDAILQTIENFNFNVDVKEHSVPFPNVSSTFLKMHLLKIC